jgi:hypothetical protein
MRHRAIKALEPWIKEQNAKEVVLLAKKYRVQKWLRDGYTRILQQPSLTATELGATPSLDWETISKLLSAKMLLNQCRGGCHDWVTTAYGVGYGCRSSVTGITVPSAMEQEFEEEFSDMSDDVSAV